MSEGISNPGCVGIVLNPGARRVAVALTRLRAAAHAVPGAVVWEVSSPTEIATVLEADSVKRLELLVVVGGDGTLQAVMTELYQNAQEGPPVLVVPGGTTNMSAFDLGARRKPLAALRALAHWRKGEGGAPLRVSRPVVRVAVCDKDGARESGPGPAYGFFFGTGGVESGVRYFHERVRGRGFNGILGPGVAFSRMLIALLTGRSHSLLAPTRMVIRGNDRVWEGDWLLVMASTLDRLLLGCRPYWGHQAGPLHFSALARNPRRLVRVLPRLLRGSGDKVAREEEGYVSANLSVLTLDTVTGFILDGERFTANSSLRVAVTSPKPFWVF